MEQKKINRVVIFFTILIFVHEICVALMTFTHIFDNITVNQNILLSQGLIFIPSLVFLVCNNKEAVSEIRVKRFCPLVILFLPLLVLCLEPIIMLINLISMMFVENYIAESTSEAVTNNSLLISLVLIALTPCVVEELAYRGIILGGLRHGGRLKAIIAAGCLFGIMHMNFNQMAYAIVLGIVFGIVVEATGSIICTMIIHFMINGISVCLSYAVGLTATMTPTPDAAGASLEAFGTVVKLVAVGMLLPVAVAGAFFSALIIKKLAKLCGREESLKTLFQKEVPVYDGGTGKKVRIMTPLLIAVIVYCILRCAVYEFI